MTADTSGAHLLPYVHLAMIYIVLRAKTIATRLRVKSLPVVVNLSYDSSPALMMEPRRSRPCSKS